MRVITGSAKGRKLKSPKSSETRPILDRVKVALFDVLGAAVVDADFLDLYAGTGGVGIEALSRGARRGVFVDLSPEAINLIKENLQITALAERAQVVRNDVLKFIEHVYDEKFDIIYIAPPQWKGMIPPTLQAVDKRRILAEHGIVVTQQHPKEATAVPLERLELYMERKYGDTLLSFYHHRAEAE